MGSAGTAQPRSFNQKSHLSSSSTVRTWRHRVTLVFPYKQNLWIAKDCLLTLVKSRLALGSPGCLFVCSFVCHHAKNGPIQRKMVIDCPLVITSKVKLFFRPDKTRKKKWMVQPVFCIVDAGSCYHILFRWLYSRCLLKRCCPETLSLCPLMPSAFIRFYIFSVSRVPSLFSI